MNNQRSSLLSQSSDGCFIIDKQNFQESLPRLKDLLEKANRHGKMRAIKTLLDPCVALCLPNLLGKTIFDETTPVARRLFFETINEVEELVSTKTFNVLDDVKERLECCENLLECWLRCLAHLEKFGKLPASELRGVLENLVEIIKRSFEHCKKSEEMYGTFFEKVTEKLTTLFRKTNEVQKLFYTVLERVIVFSNNVETELQTLVKVVSTTGKTCLLIDGLDMKSVAESWKNFTRIAISYSNDLKIFSPPCVTPHLSSLADAISSSLCTIVEDPDIRSAERSMKLYKLLVKILHKLCISYSGYLGFDAASAIIRLLVQLQRYTPACLKFLNIPLEIIDSVESNFTSGIDQLLNIVITDTELQEAYFKYETKESLDNVGYHFITLHLLVKLISTSTESQHAWRKSPHDILKTVFNNVEALEEEFFLGKLHFGTLPIYDATLTSICGLVASTHKVDFLSLEIILLKNLLEGNFWSSLLAADVWCFIDKYASSDLSYDHLVYLMSVYELLKNRSTCMERVMLGNLISRLYALSLDESKNRLIDNFDLSKAHLWSPLKNFISQSDKTFLYELTSTEVETITSTWETLDKQPSVKIWSRFLNQLTVIGTFGKIKDETVTKTLIGIWNSLKISLDEFDGINLHLINQLIMVLLKATQTIQNSEKNFSAILSILASLVPRLASNVRGEVSNYLKECTEKFENSSPELVTNLAKLYCSLIDDKNPWSKNEALESFSYITNASYNEELVMGIVDAVAGVPQICDVVSLYVSRTPSSKLNGFSSTESYLKKLYEVHRNFEGDHRCLDRRESHREEKRRKLVDEKQKPGIPDDLFNRVMKLSNDVDYLLSHKHELSESSLNKLELIAKKIISS